MEDRNVRRTENVRHVFETLATVNKKYSASPGIRLFLSFPSSESWQDLHSQCLHGGYHLGQTKLEIVQLTTEEESWAALKPFILRLWPVSHTVDIKGSMTSIKLLMLRGCLCSYLHFSIDIISNHFTKKKKMERPYWFRSVAQWWDNCLPCPMACILSLKQWLNEWMNAPITKTPAEVNTTSQFITSVL